MKSIILPEPSDSVEYLSNINVETKGIIIVYDGENAIGHITCNKDEFWNFSKDITIEPNIDDTLLKNLVQKILEKYKNATFKLLEFK